MTTSLWAVLLAAGAGTRLGARKQFLEYEAAPLFAASLRTLAQRPDLAGIALVLPDDEAGFREGEALLRAIIAQKPLGVPVNPVRGGPRRQDSVGAGLAALPKEASHVLIHDAARPFLSPALVARIVDALKSGAAGVVPSVPVVDTIKSVRDGLVLATPDRSGLVAVQTPQGFVLPALEKARRFCAERGLAVTDDASMLEALGDPNVRVLTVPGDIANVKITRPEDLALLAPKAPAQATIPVVGHGYDVHRFVDSFTPKARPLILAGVPIGGELFVQAHSDGDVLFHAAADAVLGLAGLGDIGLLFPDSDPKLDAIPSSIILREALERVREAGVELTHVDCTVVLQSPRVGPFRDRIKAGLAACLELPKQAVNVKATTEEGLGFTGARQGVAAHAVAAGLRKG